MKAAIEQRASPHEVRPREIFEEGRNAGSTGARRKSVMPPDSKSGRAQLWFTEILLTVSLTEWLILKPREAPPIGRDMMSQRFPPADPDVFRSSKKRGWAHGR